jgi:hypothetical protein
MAFIWLTDTLCPLEAFVFAANNNDSSFLESLTFKSRRRWAIAFFSTVRFRPCSGSSFGWVTKSLSYPIQLASLCLFSTSFSYVCQSYTFFLNTRGLSFTSTDYYTLQSYHKLHVDLLESFYPLFIDSFFKHEPEVVEIAEIAEIAVSSPADGFFVCTYFKLLLHIIEEG